MFWTSFCISDGASDWGAAMLVEWLRRSESMLLDISAPLRPPGAAIEGGTTAFLFALQGCKDRIRSLHVVVQGDAFAIEALHHFFEDAKTYKSLRRLHIDITNIPRSLRSEPFGHICRIAELEELEAHVPIYSDHNYRNTGIISLWNCNLSAATLLSSTSIRFLALSLRMSQAHARRVLQLCTQLECLELSFEDPFTPPIFGHGQVSVAIESPITLEKLQCLRLWGRRRDKEKGILTLDHIHAPNLKEFHSRIDEHGHIGLSALDRFFSLSSPTLEVLAIMDYLPHLVRPTVAFFNNVRLSVKKLACDAIFFSELLIQSLTVARPGFAITTIKNINNDTAPMSSPFSPALEELSLHGYSWSKPSNLENFILAHRKGIIRRSGGPDVPEHTFTLASVGELKRIIFVQPKIEVDIEARDYPDITQCVEEGLELVWHHW